MAVNTSLTTARAHIGCMGSHTMSFYRAPGRQFDTSASSVGRFYNDIISPVTQSPPTLLRHPIAPGDPQVAMSYVRAPKLWHSG